MKDEQLALELIQQKQENIGITFEQITLRTGYSKRQLIRLSKSLMERDMESLLVHDNTNKKYVITASNQEICYLRILKESYQYTSIFITTSCSLLV